MLVRQAWQSVALPFRFRLFWERVTFTKITAIYFVFSVIHCLIQVVFQTQAFITNAQAEEFLKQIIAHGNDTTSGFPVLGGDLRMCDDVPLTMNASSCPVVWGPTAVNNAANVGSQNVDYGAVTSSHSSLGDSIALSTSLSSPSLLPTTPASSFIISSSSSPSPTPLSSSLSASTSTSSNSRPTPTSTSSASETSLLSISFSSSHISPTSTQSVTTTLTVTVRAASQTDISDGSSKVANTNGSGDHLVQRKALVKRNPSVSGTISPDGTTQVTISGLDGQGLITLDQECISTLNWPLMNVEDTKREDIVFICFQVWVLGMSIVAILNESIPHIFASLLTHVLATAWGGFQIYDTKNFRDQFFRLTVNGACGANVLPDYWVERARAEIPSLILNCVALLISALLTWRLTKLFGWQTFKRVGASLTVNRVYNLVLVLSIVIQLSLFFIVVAGGLWLDQIYNGVIGSMSVNPDLHKGVISLVLILLIPWLAIGWIAVRRELKTPMHVFLLLSFLYLVGWSTMFLAPTFRWTFVQWRFFSIMASASVFLAFVSLLLGFVCRLNFGKGLARYLNAQEQLKDGDTASAFDSDDDEKGELERIEFPSNLGSIPTYSEAFESKLKFPLPARTNIRSPPLVSHLPPQYPAASGHGEVAPSNDLRRQGSSSSQQSTSITVNDSRPRRWVIE